MSVTRCSRRSTGRGYGLHSAHGLLSAFSASSRVMYLISPTISRRMVPNRSFGGSAPYDRELYHLLEVAGNTEEDSAFAIKQWHDGHFNLGGGVCQRRSCRRYGCPSLALKATSTVADLRPKLPLDPVRYTASPRRCFTP